MNNLKYTVFLYIILIQINICYPQYHQEWVRSECQNQNAFGTCVRIDKNNSIYVSGSDSYSIRQTSVYLLKYDVNGNKIWERRYGDSLYMVRGMELDRNGNILIAATFNHHGLTLKYDELGNLIWVKGLLFNLQGEITSLKIDNNNNVYVSGTDILDTLWHENYFLVKYDSAGNQLWYREYSGDNYENLTKSMAIDKNNNIYLTGDCIYNNFHWNIGTVKFSSTGNLIWERRYFYGIGSTSSSIITDSSDNIIVSGSSAFGNSQIISTIKYDSSGFLQWAKTYRSNFTLCYDYPVKLSVDFSNNIYLIGCIGTDMMKSDYLTLKYSPNGDTCWINKYINNIEALNRPRSLTVDKFLNVFITGTVTINGTSFFSIFYDSAGQIISSHIFNGNLYPTSDDAWDIAVDSSSNVYVVGRGDCENSRCKLVLVKYSKYSGIENISNQIPNNYFLSQNYPNPFNTMTKINFNIPVKTFAKIKIYDISGREIKILLNDCINPGFYSCTFDLSEFSSGIYFYCLQSGNFNETKKLVLIK